MARIKAAVEAAAGTIIESTLSSNSIEESRSLSRIQFRLLFPQLRIVERRVPLAKKERLRRSLQLND
jgi:hypothetical protein